MIRSQQVAFESRVQTAPQAAQASQAQVVQRPQTAQQVPVVPQQGGNRYQPGVLDRAARAALIEAHMPLVHMIARRIHARLPRSVELDDVIHEGYIGLIEAIDRYDECRRVPLRMFARQRITGAIIDLLRDLDWAPRTVRRKSDLLSSTRDRLHRKLGRAPEASEVAAALELSVADYNRLVAQADIRRVVSLDTPVSSDNSTPVVETVAMEDDPGARREAAATLAAVRDAVDRLPEREREAVKGFYLEGRPLVEIGAEMGVSESRASQLHRIGVNRLRYKMRSLEEV